MKFHTLPIPKPLQAYVECIRVSEHTGDEPLSIKVCLNGLPGIVFQHHEGYSPIDNITTPSGKATHFPTLYVYGQMMEVGVMNHKQSPFSTTQIILKPHALQTLLGINASALTNALVGLNEFSAGHLNMQLLEARNEHEQITLLTNFLTHKLQQVKTRDWLVEESLHLIHQNIYGVNIKYLLDCLNISERQFERRFTQTVGLSPQFYIRVKRFNEAIRLMKAQRFRKLTDLAHSLNFYDQSHFIRDIKAFSGVTPKNLSQKLDDFELSQSVLAYV